MVMLACVSCCNDDALSRWLALQGCCKGEVRSSSYNLTLTMPVPDIRFIISSIRREGKPDKDGDVPTGRLGKRKKQRDAVAAARRV